MKSVQEWNLMFDKLTNILDSFLETGIPGFDCILLQNGACVYRYYQGFSDTINRIPVNGTER